MKKIILSAIIAIGAGAVCFAASPKVRYGINATNITSIESSAAVKVVYTPSGSTSVTVTTPKELQEYLSVKVSGDKLKIGRKDSFKSSIKSLSDVTVTVHAPAVTDFEATTSSVITVTAPLKATGSEVEIEVSTAGSVTVPGITCSGIEIDASTAGTVNISGNTSAGFISAEASTGSSVKVGGISGDKVKAESSTGASITLSGNADKADLSASTGGSVQASGLKAKSISRSSSSGGSIH